MQMIELSNQKSTKLSIDQFILNKSVSILENIETILKYIYEKKELSVSYSRFLLKPKDLFFFNSKLLKPIEIDIKKPQQSSIPHLNAIFWIIRAARLIDISTVKDKSYIRINESVRREWDLLSKIEQYLTLINIWLTYARSKLIDFNYGNNSIVIFNCLDFFSKIPLETELNEKLITSIYLLRNYNLSLFEMFGLLKISHEKPISNKGWNYSKIEKTELGILLFSIFSKYRECIFKDFEESYGQDSGEIGILQPYLKKSILGFEKSLSFQKNQPILEEVEFSAVYRKNLYIIKSKSNNTINNLANNIIKSLKLESGHLYKFVYKNKYTGKEFSIFHEYISGEKFCASYFKLKDLPINLGDILFFHYDFCSELVIDLVLHRTYS